MGTCRTRRQRRIIVSVASFAAAIYGGSAWAARDVEIPLSSVIQLLVPPGSFVAYQGTVNTSELVHLPHRGSNAQRLVELLTRYGLQDTVSGYTYTIFPIGSPPTQMAGAPANAPSSKSYDSPGFSMALPPPAPPPEPAPVAVASIVAVPSKPGQPVNLYAATVAPTADRLPPPVMLAPPPPLPVWTLVSGTMISKDLETWAPEAGWQLQWDYPKDFVVPATTPLRGAFPDVVAQVVTALRKQLAITDPQNANIHADTYTVNHVMIVNTASESVNNGE